ncbi:phosphoserine phosphatase SerB [Bartonella sp. DGB2]|uniref:phosphoserine phosphatase SerB n=1 Tax=Bartonella sp. DGB2 TaxID=3388426 RepID=UPI00398FD943
MLKVSSDRPTQPHIATLIANPNYPILTLACADKAYRALNASHLYWLSDNIACDILLPDSLPHEEARLLLQNALNGLPIDIIIQPQEGRRKKLLLADMDSTMIEQECIDELGAAIGMGEEIANITHRAMHGEIAFEPALRERVALLKGLSLTTIAQLIKTRLTLRAGGKTLLATMRHHGGYSALVSGGFTLFTANIAQTLGFDEHHANQLSHDGHYLDGEIVEPILGQQAKLDTLHALCRKRGLSPQNAMAVGDGANDLAMLQAAGAGVALHAKPIVAQAASMRIDHGDLSALLYIQGYRQSDFVSQ